jgi:hypothetical protein
MSQNDFNIANQGFPSFRSDLNSALQALASNSAGTSAPSTTYAYMWWYDSTNDILKFRNADNDAWIDFATFDQAADAWSFAALIVDGDLTVDTDTLYVDSANNRVGVGTASPSTTLHVTQVGDTVLTVKAQSSGAGNDDDAFINLDTTETGEAAVQFYQDGILKAFIDWYSEGGPDLNIGTVAGSGANIDLQTEGAVAMRIDSSGDVWINGNNSTTDTRVLRVQSEGYAVVKINGDLSNSAGEPGGSALQLALDGTGINGVVSYINSADDSGYGTTYTGTLVNSMLVGTTGSQALFFGINSAAVLRVGATYLQPVTDNVFDLGQPANRYDDVYATNGTIQTSDASEKQDIAELDEAEKRVAVAAKGLIRKYRWKDAVAEKGDAARIHVGIIAQDLQAAFAAEGLDAGRYAMFISSTWWEHEGQTYETAEEAPEGATERTRLGVRYPELLAFIIGAL